MTDDLRGLTQSERDAYDWLDGYLCGEDRAMHEWGRIRAALSRVPVAGEAVDALKFDLDMISAALESPTAATMDRIKRIRTALFAAPPSPPVASDDEREIARDCAASMGYPGPAIATPPADDARDAALTYEVASGQLVVRIGVDTLAHALQTGDDWCHEFRITDAHVFAQAVVAEMENHEDERGETAITRTLTEAATRAIESAADGVEEVAAMPADQAQGNAT
jgi:hypothetical protein